MAGMPLPFVAKLVIALVWDGIDLAFGWVPVFGTLLDILGTGLAILLVGLKGIIYGWEVIAFGPGNVVDAVIPTMTLLVIMDMGSGS
jgi:hypothetical protein